MKWFSAAALAVLLCACTKTETTTSETSSTTTSETSSTVAAPAGDTSSTVVPVPTETVSTNPSTGATSTSTSTSAPTGSTGSTGMSGATGTSGSTTTHTENLGNLPGPMTSAAPDLVADGMATYKAKGCATCHGVAGAGDTAIGKKNNIRDFHSAGVQKQSDEELTKILTEGKGPVSKAAHKSKNLTDLQVKSVIAWIRTLK